MQTRFDSRATRHGICLKAEAYLEKGLVDFINLLKIKKESIAIFFSFTFTAYPIPGLSTGKDTPAAVISRNFEAAEKGTFWG